MDIAIVLPMVIKLTLGIITDWGNPSFNSFGGGLDTQHKMLGLFWVYVVWDCIQYDLRSAPILWQWGTSCTIFHIILTLAYLSYYPYVPSTVFSWCYNLSVPLGNQGHFLFMSLAPKLLLLLYTLGAKAFLSITLPRAVDRETHITPESVFYCVFVLVPYGFSVSYRFE